MDNTDQPKPITPESDASQEPDPQLSLWSSDSVTQEESVTTAPAALYPPWTLSDIVSFIMFVVVSFIVVNMAAITGFLALKQYFGWSVSIDEALTQTSFVVLMQGGWETLWLVFLYFLITIKFKQAFWSAIQWNPTPQSPALFLMAGVLLAFSAQAIFLLFPSDKELPIERLFSSPFSAYLLAGFGICVAPFVEELVFRGFFYPVFEQKWGLVPAVWLTALVFAAIHVPQLRGGWQEIAAIFFVGAAFSYCRGKTRSLLPPYLMHVAYNASLFVGLYLSTDRFQALKN